MAVHRSVQIVHQTPASIKRHSPSCVVDAEFNQEDHVAGPFAGIKLNPKIRYALLAGTMLPLVALPQSSIAESGLVARPAQSAIILAQAVVDPNDPKAKDKAKLAPAAKPVTPTAPGPPSNQRSLGQPSGNNQPANTQQKIIQQTNTPTLPNNQQTNTQKNILEQNQQTNTGNQPGKPVYGRTNPGTTTTNIQGTQGNQGPQGTQSNRTIQGIPGPQGVQGLQDNRSFQGTQPGQQRVINAPIQGVSPTTGARTVQPAPGAITNIKQLEAMRVVKHGPNGSVVVTEPGQTIVQEQGRTYVVPNHMERLRLGGTNYQTKKVGNETFTYINRGEYRIANVTGPDGRLLRRLRYNARGEETVIFRNKVIIGAAATGLIVALAAPRILIPPERYIVDASTAEPTLLYETLAAAPLAPLDQAYSLEQVRMNYNLRAYMPSLVLDSITFETGSWEIGEAQYPKLAAVADAIKLVLAANPNSILLIEGHTDPVGDEFYNLSLSQRRADAVAIVLTDVFGIPAENLETQGYGKQFLKINEPGPNRSNRRVEFRNITLLLGS
jgi:OOP family OmpA-OmpF porin